jgi:catechol 2,3-dioxygenase
MEFYRNVAGFEECFQEPPMNAGLMGNGNTHHDVGLTQVSDEDIIGRDNQVLVPAGFGKKPGLFHLAFELECEADLVEGYEKAVKAGVRIVMTVDHTIAKSVYLLDPEGTVLELTSDSTTDWRQKYDEFHGKLITGPWQPGKDTPSTTKYYPVNPAITCVSDALMHSRRATHAVLACRDFHTQLAFYKEVIGLEEAFGPSDAGVSVLKGTSDLCSAVLFDSGAARKRGLHHVAYEVPESDMEGAEARLNAADIPVLGSYTGTGKRSIFIRDPDGLGVEFYTLKSSGYQPPAGEAAKSFWMTAE